MAFNYEALLNLRREMEQTYTVRDTILYAIGVGAALNPEDQSSLRYVYEEGLRALPTMSTVIAAPGFWQREHQFGIEWQKILHGEQSVSMHKPLPVEGAVSAVLTTEGIYDKGAEKGAIIYTMRKLYNSANGDLLAEIRQGSFLRGNGGQGGLKEGAPKPKPTPDDRSPDESIDLETRPEQALIYRLLGDFNPLHADPVVAKAAGFPRPILHGLATYGIVGRAVLARLCGDDPTRLRRLDVRFASPVFPGDTVTTEMWKVDPGKVAFRARVSARQVTVINNGYAEYEE